MSTAKQYSSKAKVLEVLSINIKAIRHANNLTQKELSKKSGVSYNTISLIEMAELFPTLYSLILISDALKVSLSDLFKIN